MVTKTTVEFKEKAGQTPIVIGFQEVSAGFYGFLCVAESLPEVSVAVLALFGCGTLT
jgi:hypothetical protein